MLYPLSYEGGEHILAGQPTCQTPSVRWKRHSVHVKSAKSPRCAWCRCGPRPRQARRRTVRHSGRVSVSRSCGRASPERPSRSLPTRSRTRGHVAQPVRSEAFVAFRATHAVDRLGPSDRYARVIPHPTAEVSDARAPHATRGEHEIIASPPVDRAGKVRPQETRYRNASALVCLRRSKRRDPTDLGHASAMSSRPRRTSTRPTRNTAASPHRIPQYPNVRMRVR